MSHEFFQEQSEQSLIKARIVSKYFSAYKQGSLFELLPRPLDDLQDLLIQQYAGCTIDFDRLYNEHSVDKPYVRKNYKKVLSALLDEGKITAMHAKTGKPPRKGTLSDDMQITFGG